MIDPDEVRRFALSLPGAVEKETWGEATFRVRDKIFITLGRTGIGAGVKATLDDQDALIKMDPETFRKAHYTGRFGWVSVRLASVDPTMMKDLILDAWRRTAPKRVAAAYDASRGGSEP